MASHDPPGRKVDEARVPQHELPEGLVAVSRQMAGQKFLVGDIIHCSTMAAGSGIRQNFRPLARAGVTLPIRAQPLPQRVEFATEALDGRSTGIMNLPLLLLLVVVSAGSILFFANRYRAASAAQRGRMIWAAVGSAAVAAKVGLLFARA